ncbi:FkbM family methyltransferase [Agathobaculum sp. LCP25S3_E8]|uniref:FkbM family methyltransferase n=1 Tax=Agathobaculum sp. LCP25S3_E8 TaxID=3438735 RepID=UPI003F8FDC1F
MDGPFVLYGFGIRAAVVYHYMKQHGVDVQHVVISRRRYVPNQHLATTEKCVECMEDVLERNKAVNLVLGLPRYLLEEKFEDFAQIQNVIDTNFGILPEYNFDYSYFEKNEKEWQWLYDSLQDDLSREMLCAHINGRITGRSIPFERAPWSDPQYFLDDLMIWKDHEVVVDCGAYDGDNAEEFLRKKPDSTQYTYYALEPENENFEKMCAKFEGNDNFIMLKLGAWSKKEVLHISGTDETAAFTNDEGIEIQADTIDHIVSGEKHPVTFIKMDIEGSELEALKGAEQTIRKYTPRLAICCYHKKEDLITIPKWIHGINPKYRFYLKPHSSMPTELVLFCV